MTRLSRFCEALTREMIAAAYASREAPDKAEAAARAVAEVRVREFARDVDSFAAKNVDAYLDEPAGPTG